MEETTKDIIDWINSNGWTVSIFTLILGAYLNTLLTKNKEVLMKIADKKGQYYSEYINALLDFNKTHYERFSSNGNNGDIDRKYFCLKNLVILYGSNEVIEKLSICEKNGIQFKTDEGKNNYLDLIKAMKKDIENPRIIKSLWGEKQSKYNRGDNIAITLFDYKKE